MMDLAGYLAVFQEILLALFNGETASGPSAATMQRYLDMGANFFESLTIHVIGPGLILLILWYFISYVIQLVRSEGAGESGVTFFFKRMVALLFGAILILPCQSVFGVDDQRPTAMWAVFKSAEAGMELAGHAIQASTGSQGALGDELGQSIGNYHSAAAGNDIGGFVCVPVMISGFIDSAREQVNDVYEEAEAAAFQDMSYQARISAIFKKSVDGVVESVGGVVTGGVGMALAALGSPGIGLVLTALGGVASLGSDTVLSLAGALSDLVFATTMMFAWYTAVIVLLIRVLIYGFVGTLAGITIPMGRWGQEKAAGYAGNILGMMLTPFVMGVAFFTALAARVVYMAALPIMLETLKLMGMNPASQMFTAMVIAFCGPFFVIIPCAAVIYKTPSYLSGIIGHLFTAQTGIESRLRAPLAK